MLDNQGYRHRHLEYAILTAFLRHSICANTPQYYVIRKLFLLLSNNCRGIGLCVTNCVVRLNTEIA